MKKRVLSLFMALALCLTLLPAPAWAAETENNVAVQANTANVETVNPDCPVCAAEDADLSACKGTEQAAPLMAAAADDGTISGNVTWANKNITTPVRLTGDTTITLEGKNTITISDTAELSALEMDYRSLTIQGSGSLTVTVPKGKYGIADSAFNDTPAGHLP